MAAAGTGNAAGGAAIIGAALGAPVGPPGGSVGSLMVGAAVGFGGKLMRTVSFFGCTLPVSFFGGGTAPDGPGKGLTGGMSAIVVLKISAGAHVSMVNSSIIKNRSSLGPSGCCR